MAIPTKAGVPGGRIYQLDAVRGLGALTVVLYHFFCVLAVPFTGGAREIIGLLHFNTATIQGFGAARLIEMTPLRIAVAGHEAVVLFFLLSGFVLSLPFYKGVSPSYAAFAAKRICRLYLPYLAALSIAVSLNYILGGYALPGMNTWFNEAWSKPFTARDVVNHILFIGNYNNQKFNVAFWSLVVEMRLSLVFPLLVQIPRRMSAGASLAIAGALSVIGIACDFLFRDLRTDYFLTVHYAAIFMVGAVLARHLKVVGAHYAQWSWRLKLALLCTAFVLYVFAGRLLNGMERSWHLRGLEDWPILCGSVLFVVFALFAEPVQGFLSSRSVSFLGQISYSVYLLHATILFSLIYLLYPVHNFFTLFVVYLGVVALAASLFYKTVEVPSIILGRRTLLSSAASTPNSLVETPVR